MPAPAVSNQSRERAENESESKQANGQHRFPKLVTKALTKRRQIYNIKTQNFGSLKVTLKKMKRQATNWEKIFGSMYD